MNRIAVVVGLLVATAALARAQDEALAKAAVNRARESLQAFDGADLERVVDVDAKRARFVRDLDDAQAEVDALPPGSARDIGGHSLNRIAIDALFARALRTAGLNRSVDLISLDDVTARLDRAVLGQDAPAVVRALNRVHAAVSWERPGGLFRVKPDYLVSLEQVYDSATQAVRALVPTQRRYAQLLGARLTVAVRDWRKVPILVEHEEDREWTDIKALGTVIDKAWLDARTPPFVAQNTQLLDSSGYRKEGPILWKVYARRNTVPGATVQLELMAPDGRLLARAVGPESTYLQLPVPPGTKGEGHVLLATLEDPDGTVHTKATLLLPDWFEVPEAAPTETPGLVGGLSR